VVASLINNLDYTVFAMPRSMSRWLSFALSFNGHTCYHDVEHDKSLPYEKGLGVSGSCETGASIDGSKGIVLLREPSDSLKSLSNAYGLSSKALSDFVNKRYDELSSSKLPIYKHSDLESPNIVAEIQSVLLGESMPLGRIHDLLATRITVSKRYLYKRLQDAAI
jgi:hypothetical protein